jgi:hypothetical protein
MLDPEQITEGEMKTNWEHQKKAITTDQKFRTDDEHIHELDKRHLKEDEKTPDFIVPPAKKAGRAKKK